jgi:hypothetical protein
MTNLIGIGHKIGTGKDTVANIIKLTTAKSKYIRNRTYIDRLFGSQGAGLAMITEDTEWETKKYADKLKDIVCILIGCTREQLEDPEFKENSLGEEWTKYPVSVDIVINPLDPENCEVSEELHYFSTKEEAKSFADKQTVERHDYEAEAFVEDKEILTPRKLLQELGTDVCRQIHPSMWVNALFADYKEVWNDPDPILGNDYTISYKQKTGKETSLIQYADGFSEAEVYDHEISAPSWIISDVRFRDEAQAIKDRGGIVIKVNRDVSHDEHKSEKALDGYTGWDYVIDNNGSIEGLVDQVETMLKHFKIT